MAVTRIKNNQITTASGNVADGTGINAAVKLQDYTITSTKIANSLVYGSDLTVSGNLTVNGTTTTIDTVNTLIEDPIITLADGQTSGTPTVDIGVLGLRGSENSSFLGWNEGNTEFAAILTTTTSSNTTVVISSYANFHANNITAGGNLSIAGNIVGNVSFTGNITAGNLLSNGVMSAAGNVTGGNVLTAGLVSATGTITSAANITGGNILTGGIVSATGNVTGSNVTTTGDMSATGNVYGGNIITGGNISGVNVITANTFNGVTVSASGNVTGGNVNFGTGIVSGTGNIYADTIFANISGNIDAAGSNTEIQFNGPGDLLAANANFTYDYATNLMTVNGGNIATGNLSTTSQVSATGNITGANILTAGLISATGNITSAAGVNTPNITGATGLIITTGTGNIDIQPTSGNVVLSNTYVNSVAYPAQAQDAANKEYVDNMVSSGLAFHPAVTVATTANLATTTSGSITYTQPNGAANGIGALIQTTGSFDIIDTANVQTVGTRILVKNEGNAVLNGVYTWSNATAIIRSSDADQYGPNSSEELSLNDYFFVQSGNVNLGSAYVVDAPTGVITFGTSNISFAQFSQSQVYSANVNAGLTLVGQTFNAKVDNDTTAFGVGGNISVKAGANLVTPNIGAATGTSLSVTGAVDAGTTMSAAGNITGGNILTVGLVSATGNVIGGNVTTVGDMSATGNVYGGNIITGGNISGVNVITANTFNGVTVSASGNVTGGNVLTGGIVSATGNVTGGNVNFGTGIVSGTGNIYADTIFANISGNIDAAGSNTEIQFNSNGILGANANFTYDYLTNLFQVLGGNILVGNANVISTSRLANIVITGNDLTSLDGLVNINAAGFDTDFAVTGDTVANVFYVDAGTGTASFGSNVQTANAIAAFNASNSILLPVGNTSQRPGGTPTTGMIRFNTSLNAVEVYDNSQWIAVGAPVFTVIADELFNGDGSTVAFTLSSTQTTNSCIVSINGVVQIPTLAYSVSGTDPTCVLTFTEAPATGDLIDVREVTTTTTVSTISNSSGNAVIEASGTAAQINIEGNLIPIADNVYSLGNATNSWQSLHVAGNTIYLGSLQLKEATANTFAVYTADGVTEANIQVGNIDVTSIQSGTSTISIAAPNGNAVLNVASSNIVVAASTGAYVTGIVTATGNIRGANINTDGIVSVLGNVVSGNVTTTGLISATGNVTGGNVSSAGNVTGGNILTAGAISATGAGYIGGGLSVIGNITATGNLNYQNVTDLVVGDPLIYIGANNTSNLVDLGIVAAANVANVYQHLGLVRNHTTGIWGLFGNVVAEPTTTIDWANAVYQPFQSGAISSTGNVTAANLSVGTGTITVGNIVNSNANGVGNIGSSTTYFNTVFAKATSAQYADLAEMYAGDAAYAPGTVVSFGGANEVTQSTVDADRRVAGVVSTNPSYIMNAGQAGDNVVAVALTGRVPTSVTGAVAKGDLMVSNGDGTARSEADPKVGTVIGKALEDFAGGTGTIEVVVGRF